MPYHHSLRQASKVLAVLGLVTLSSSVLANTKVAIGISGWTGFGPLVLAQKEGLFAKHGVDVDIQMIPQKDRLLAIASNSLQCAATTIETYIPWNLRVPIKQIVMLDKSYGADGLAARNDIKSFSDLKGKTVAVDAKGTTSYFGLAWMLNENHMSMSDINVNMLSPSAAAQSFVAGQNDAAMTYEPYLSKIREAPQQGHILATTLDYPMVMDSLGCQTSWLEQHPEAAKGLVEGYFDALEMIHKDPKKSYAIMGSVVKQSGEEFEKSAAYLRWQDRSDNKQFFQGVLQNFTRKAGDLMLKNKLIPKLPNLQGLYDGQYVQ
ncbi:ABC transporter substrate-binding protein [Celerinatantimonas sp. YJH-8]|uniref:ABC transporter substrate-binding protein n=1 Tax=Celerinatantimonas sp. YJH-8 TaxID=3228714 RepID=UPI0038C34964